ncbi:cystathionine beta-synthase [Ruicaihuangia caeni]|uniref:cystathionine beta-synthase n=1 Tax=Ruicaihuangia caeni TaxID=3042517 RepID=UPI00338D7026
MKYAASVIDLVGDTPLVKLNHVTADVKATVLVKLEYLNPGGSSKDRIATRIIDAAEREGKLKRGGTIVEPTSGNTGVGLALVAQQRGYRCVFVCPDKVGEDKRNVLKAYGAEVVVTPTSVAPDSPESYYSVSDRLAREIPGAFKPNQYENQNGPLSHYETTGPEIWRDTDERITHFVAGVGTGGTISGTGRYLKEVSDNRVRIIGADPEGSIYSGGGGRPYLVEGVGEDFWPGAYDPKQVDEIIEVTDAESFDMTRRLALEEGILVGGSSGMAVVAALKAAASLDEDAVVVVLLPDGGRGYLGKIFNDTWMDHHGFGEEPDESEVLTVRDVLDESRADAGDAGASGASGTEVTRGTEPLIAIHRDATVREAVEAMAHHGVTELAVLSAAQPVVLGEVAGAVTQSGLLSALAEGGITGDTVLARLDSLPESALPLVGANEPIEEAERLLDERGVGSALVLDLGKPIATITRAAILRHRALAHSRTRP